MGVVGVIVKEEVFFYGFFMVRRKERSYVKLGSFRGNFWNFKNESIFYLFS